jgi:dTMP kinase
MAKKGKLIVLEGTDGSGKATQTALLMNKLIQDGYTVKIVDFPEYYKNFFGAFIGHCLSEQYYKFIGVHPKIASVLYAADRWESSEKIKNWLKKGYVVIANRYVGSNQIHQGGKIKSAQKRKDFLRWLDDMEYRVFGIPRPNMVFYLSLPIDLVLHLLKKRESSKMKREYLRKHKDVHESDVNFLKNSIKSALWLTKISDNWEKIECSKNGKIFSREEIHQKIYEKIKKILR